MNDSFKCSCCGEIHDGLPLDYGHAKPDYYFEIPEHEREKRIFLSSDICVVDKEHFFVRGCIEIPIIDHNDNFRFGVWCSLSEKSYTRVKELWDSVDVENEPPFFGWLNSTINERIYPDTLNLKTMVHLQNDNLRPRIELEPSDHPLAIDQKNGITLKRVQEIAEIILH